MDNMSKLVDLLNSKKNDPNFRETIKKMQFLLEHFDTLAYDQAIKNGEKPTAHMEMIPSMFKDVNYYITAGSPGRVLDILLRHEDRIIQTIRPDADVARSGFFGIYEDEIQEKKFKVCVFSTNMGPSQVEINYGLDLLSVAPNDMTVIRVGTAGTLQPNIGLGDIVAGTSALGLDGVTDFYVDGDYIAQATADVLSSLYNVSSKRNIDVKFLPIITKSSLQSEIGETPKKDTHNIIRQAALDGNVGASSMESSVIYALSDLATKGKIYSDKGFNISCGTVLAIVNNYDEGSLFADSKDLMNEAITNSVKLVEEAIKYLVLNNSNPSEEFESGKKGYTHLLSQQKEELRKIQRRMREAYNT